jgi:hypothetical protein
MAEIQRMFAGTMSPEDVLRAGEAAGGQTKFYADLYAGLYYEAVGQPDKSLQLIQFAAKNPDAKGNYMRDVAIVHVKLRTEQVLRHAVFFKFKDASSKDDVARVVEAFRALPSKIEEIHEFELGERMNPAGISGGFTHCFLLTFKDEAGRDAYLPHPDHKAFGGIVGPHLEKVFVIDYWGRRQDTGLEKQLKHAVFFKFNEDASKDDVRAVEESLAALPSKIDTIKGFEWGTNNSPETHDEGFTHCFMFTFGSEEGLKEYAEHPAHVAAANALRSKVEKVRVIDFWAEDVPSK